MKNVKIYFVLYVALLCETFIVIYDRDEALDELKPLIITGVSFDFELTIPDSNISLSIFSTSQSNQIAKSDLIKTLVLGKSFLQTDKDIELDRYFIKPPKTFQLLDTTLFKLNLVPVIKDSVRGDYILTMQYEGPRIPGFTGSFDTCEIRIKCKLKRLVSSRIRKELNKSEKNYDMEIVDKSEYILLEANKTITIIFNRTYFKVQC